MAHPSAPTFDPQSAARFARQVVERLDAQGFQALWAGGCVRDRLMGKEPKDYDVATNATPDQVRALFGRRRTRLVGAAFGVVTVVGPHNAGQIEVATFRRDEGYSDGRHPDHVSFSTAEEDAQRRDFTINGLFFDPLNDRILDYVDGRADIDREIIRCIGDPHRRFDEDKLRMLRAVRFATVLGFALDAETAVAIQEHADETQLVSAERIAAEMRYVLTDRHHAIGLQLLRSTDLWRAVLPEYASLPPPERDPQWQRMMTAFGQLPTPLSMTLACAALLWPVCPEQEFESVTQRLAKRWRLTNPERKAIGWLLEHVGDIRGARQRRWPQLQPILADPRAHDLLALARAAAVATAGPEADLADWQYCHERLSWPLDRLDPRPLISGDQLRQLGIPPGPALGDLLRAVRDAQLEGQLHSTAAAIAWAKQQWNQSPPPK
jgi:tRNA nucleotidyltransferase/poly(A) polymerase